MFKMNDTKTEMMIFASLCVKLSVLTNALGAKSHQPAGQVRRASNCGSSYKAIVLSFIFQAEDPSTFVTASLDYCNSILVRIPDAAVQKLKLCKIQPLASIHELVPLYIPNILQIYYEIRTREDQTYC